MLESDLHLDVTDLRCVICNAAYSLNAPRVVRRLRGSGDVELARLCWVCAHLQIGVQKEIALERGQGYNLPELSGGL
jgi:hypothetical protein